MEISNKVLESRENKKKKIASLIDKYQIVTVHANIPGDNKNIKEAYLIVNHFSRLVLNLKPIKYEIEEGIDGITAYFYFDNNECLKEKCVNIEESDPLGRFVDIDVYYNDTTSVSRNSLRKCYICDDYAFVCNRLKRHTKDELIKHIEDKTKKYMMNLIIDLANSSMLNELNLEPKFGLVTPNDHTCHKDMDYNTMIIAKDSILKYFYDMFEVGFKFDDLKEIHKRIRKIGLDAEDDMYLSTNNINAYKGLIFVLGTIVASIGYKLSRYSNDTIYDICRNMTYGITNELKDGIESFGKEAYQKYQITGARGEAMSGFKNVSRIVSKYNLENDKTSALIDLIINVDDTILLKRCKSFEKYCEVKNWFKQETNLSLLNKRCIENNLSFGGSADLLVASMFVKEIEKGFII